MKIRKRLLRGIAGVFAGVCALALTKNMVMAGSGVKLLADCNVGAAQILDNLESVDENVVVQHKDTGGVDDDDEDSEPHTGLVMADVRNYLNVREEPSVDASVTGYLYADCGGTIIETTKGWTKIESGKVVGWASNDYLIFGKEAEELAQDVGHTFATIEADGLRVRKAPSEEAGVWGMVKKGDVIETNPDRNTEDWLSIEFEGSEGFISAEYVDIEFKIDVAESYEDVQKRKKEEEAAKAAAAKAAAEKKKALTTNQGAVAVDAADDVLLAALIQCEGGNQPYEGQLAVAAVVMNRVRSAAYPNTVSGVIYASGQFGPAASGKVAARVQAGVKDSCLQAAREAINGATNVGTATHFKRVGSHDGIVIGDHVFW